MPQPFIKIRNLQVNFGELEVLSDINIDIMRGETVALLGPSGCGKSTLLRAMAGIVPQMVRAKVKGNICVAGTLDMMFQDGNLLPWRTVMENITLGNEVLGKESDMNLVRQMIKATGLDGFEHAYPRQLSGGMRQRVALLSSLAISPQILFMDEPFGSLDAMTREEMWILVEKICTKEKLSPTLVMVTHSVEEAVVLSNRILIMKSKPGQIVDEVLVKIERPRLSADGISQECLSIINSVRLKIRKVTNGHSE
jgi:NitT/TauT family transport system ATP-binding protein